MAEKVSVGYILKQYPRLSETFILHELLALQAAGVVSSVYSLRPANEGRFHAALADYHGPVSYPRSLGKASAAGAFAALAHLDFERYGEAMEMLDQVPTSRRADLLVQAIEISDSALAAGVTHLHAHFLTIASHVAYLAHILTGLPFSVTAHAKDIYRHTVDWDLANTISAAADTIVTVCDANRRHLQSKLGADARIERIYNGLVDPVMPAELSQRDPNVILAIGRLVEKKGFDVLLDAMTQMDDQTVRCVVLGDGDELESLRLQSVGLGISDRVEFTGAVSQSEVGRWLRRATVLAAPCLVGSDGNQDALPTVLLEALAAGLPSVSTPVAGIPEIITDGIQGLIVPSDDPSSLADALSRIMNDPELWTKMATAGPVRLAERFDRASTISELIDVFASRSPATI